MKLQSKKFIAMFLVVTLVLSFGTIAYAKTFSDVPTSFWGYAAINDLSDKNIISGYPDGAFKPNATIGNAEFTTLITKAYCTQNNLALPGAATASQNWYDPVFTVAVANKIITANQFAGKESSPITRSDIALLTANALPSLAVPANVSAVLDNFTDAASIKALTSAYQNAIAKIADANIIAGDNNKRYNPTNNATRAESATIISNYLSYVAPKQVAGGSIMIAAAASLQNVFEKGLIPEFENIYPNIKVTGTFDSSGKLQTQIESGLEADIFFSAATTQMDALKDQGLMDADTIVNLLENKIVLIKTKGITTTVTSFENITNASVIAIGDPASVPAGQYAQEVFTSLGNWDDVLKKSSLGTNVTEVLSWVAAGSAEVGVVYATDAASNQNVEIIAEAPAGSLKQPVLYPIGITANSKNKPQAQAFLDFLKSNTAKAIFESYGFTVR